MAMYFSNPEGQMPCTGAVEISTETVKNPPPTWKDLQLDSITEVFKLN